MRSLLCYRVQCSSCNATYYGKIRCYFKFRVSEYIEIFALTGKNIKSTKILLCVRDHLLVSDNIVSFEDFSVLANGTNEFRIKLQENLLIHRGASELNKTSESAPLMLFSQHVPHWYLHFIVLLFGAP